MNSQDYLENRIKNCSHYQLTEEDKTFIKDNSLREFLFKQMTRKKFRRWRLPDEAREKINRVLDNCIPENKPIVFRFRFGGYKLWRFPTTPEVEWAEFFTIAHYCEFLSPLIAAYKPGIKLYFASDDVFVERLNNIPKSHTDAYYNSFQKLLDQFRKYFPKNYEVDMIRHSSLFNSEEEFEKEFAIEVAKAEKIWKTKRTAEQLEKGLKTSEMNVKWDGVEDLTNLSDKDKKKKIEKSLIYHDALVTMPTIKEWSSTPDKIAVFTTSFPGVIAVGVTKSSTVRFWVGTGVLQKTEDGYKDIVMSIQQYNSIKDLPFEEEDINLIPLKNFSKIRIYEQDLNFSNFS